MSDWNEQAAPNNNLPAKTIRSSKLRLNRQNRFRSQTQNHLPENKQ
jgi:hypothetical protein